MVIHSAEFLCGTRTRSDARDPGSGESGTLTSYDSAAPYTWSRPTTLGGILKESTTTQKEDAVGLAHVRCTARLRLEPIGCGHAEDLWRLFQDPAVAEWYGAWTLDMAQREAARIAQAWETEGIHKWMAYDRLTDDLIGRGGLSRAHMEGQERLEIGWALHRRFWGQGYATEIGRAGLAVAFAELDAAEVISYTEARNTRSRAVMERLGFRYSHDIRDVDDSEPFALYVHRRSWALQREGPRDEPPVRSWRGA